jgi:hypothetical protein
MTRLAFEEAHMSVVTNKHDMSINLTGRCTFCGGYLFQPFIEYHAAPNEPAEETPIVTMCKRCCRKHGEGFQADLIQVMAHIREHPVINCTGVIITTNHKCDGLFLPAEDRRHYVAWSERTMADFDDNYWNAIWRWYEEDGGCSHVAAYLHKVDLTSFYPKDPPRKTEAFWTIVNSNQAPEDSELADILDRLGNPDATTLAKIQNEATSSGFAEWLRERKNRRQIPHRFESCGYVPVRNDAAKDGQWKISGIRQTVYAKATLTRRDQIAAAQRL